MELMEEKYNDKSLNVEFEPIEDYIKNFEKLHEPLFAKTLFDIGIS